MHWNQNLILSYLRSRQKRVIFDFLFFRRGRIVWRFGLRRSRDSFFLLNNVLGDFVDFVEFANRSNRFLVFVLEGIILYIA